MQRHTQNDAAYGHTDAMELTPSVLSHSQSDHKDPSNLTSLDYTADKRKSLLKDEPLTHNQSNDSIMNPQITGGLLPDSAFLTSNMGQSYHIPSNQENSNIQILEQFTIDNGAGFSMGSNSQRGRTAKISLHDLQNSRQLSQLSNNEMPLPIMSPLNMIPTSQISSGRFGMKSTSTDQKLPSNINFNRMDEEEKFLDEQFQILSNNQRQGSKASEFSGRRNMAVMSNSSNQRNLDNFGNESRDSHRGNAGQTLNYTNGITASENDPTTAYVRVGPFPGSTQIQAANESYSSHRSNQLREIRDSQSQQSLLNRNTSPWINHNNVSGSNEGTDSETFKTNGRMQQISTPDPVILNQDANRRRDNSMDSIDSQNTRSLAFNEANFRLMQQKITSQAERLLVLQQTVASGPRAQRPPMWQEGSKLQSRVSELEKIIEQKDHHYEELHSNFRRISKSVYEQARVQEKLKMAEDHLRKETLVTEEQRATIQILRQGMEANLNKLGICFSKQRGQQQIDGYLHLIKTSQECDSLRREVSDLKDKLSHFEENHQLSLENARIQASEQIAQLKEMHQKQLQDKDQHLSCVLEDKELSRREKEQSLQQNRDLSAKQESHQQIIVDLKVKLDVLTHQKQELDAKHTELVKQKANQDQLIQEVKQNIQEMRNQREGLESEINQLKVGREKLKKELVELREKNRVREAEIMNLNLSLIERKRTQDGIEQDLNQTMNKKDQEIIGIKERLKKWQEQLSEKDEEITKQKIKQQDLKSKLECLEMANLALKSTLQQTQNELSGLVDEHAALTQRQSLKSQEVMMMASEIVKYKKEIAELKGQNKDFESRLELQDLEAKGMQDKLNKKTNYIHTTEQQSKEETKIKDAAIQVLQKKLEELQHNINDKNGKIEFLEKVKEGLKLSEKNMERSIEMKQRMYDDLNREFTILKSDYDKQNTILEHTMNDRTQRDNEFKLTMQIDQLTQEVNTLKQQKEYADKLIYDRMGQLKENGKKGITQEQLQNLQDQIQSSRVKADEIIAQNEALKSKLKMQRELFDVFTKKALKMNGKVAKFCKQVSRVQGLEEKYTYLFQVTQDHKYLKVPSESQKYSATEWVQLLDGLQTCINLIKSQMKHQIIQNEQIGTENSTFDLKLDLIQNDKIPQRGQKSTRSKRGGDTADHEEYLKNKIQNIEAVLKIEKDIRHETENILSKVMLLQSVKPSIRQMLSLIQGCLQSMKQNKNESRLLGSKLLEQEQQYDKLIQNDQIGLSSQHKVQTLKSQIEKDRVALTHIEKNTESAARELQQNILELLRLDSNIGSGEGGQQMRVLEDKLNEMRSQYEQVNTRKEWLEARLTEMELIQVQMQTSVNGQFSGRSSRRRIHRPNSAHGAFQRNSELCDNRGNSPYQYLRTSTKNPEDRQLPPLGHQVSNERPVVTEKNIATASREGNFKNSSRDFIQLGLPEEQPGKSRLTFNLRNFGGLNLSNEKPSRDKSSLSPSYQHRFDPQQHSENQKQSSYAKNMTTQLGLGTQKFGNLVYREELRDSLDQMDAYNFTNHPTSNKVHTRIESEVSMQNIMAHRKPSVDARGIMTQQASKADMGLPRFKKENSAATISPSNKNDFNFRNQLPRDIHQRIIPSNNSMTEEPLLNDVYLRKSDENAYNAFIQNDRSQSYSNIIGIVEEQQIDENKSNPLRSSSPDRSNSHHTRSFSPNYKQYTLTTTGRHNLIMQSAENKSRVSSPGLTSQRQRQQDERNQNFMSKGNYLLPLQQHKEYGAGLTAFEGKTTSERARNLDSNLYTNTSGLPSNVEDGKISYVVTNANTRRYDSLYQVTSGR